MNIFNLKKKIKSQQCSNDLITTRCKGFLPGVPGIVAQVASLLSQPACVFRPKYRTEKYLLRHKVMLPHPV
jgi:hypothetical protein